MSGQKLIFILILTLLIQVGLITGLRADEHKNFVSDKIAQKFIGIWKVKRRGGSFFNLTGWKHRALWSIRKKNNKLIINIPESDVVFDDIKIDGNRLFQKIIKSDANGISETETSIDLEVVEGLFDGEFIDKDARIAVSGRYEDLYRSARKAEKVYLDKLEAEKKKLGDRLNKTLIIEKENANLRLKLKGMGSKETWEKRKNQDLRNLRNQYKKKNNALLKKTRNETNQLKKELSKERQKPPRVSVARLPRDTQVYKTTNLKAGPSREARTYFKVRKNQALIRMANLNNGWSLVATDRGDMGFVVTTHLRAVTGSIPPIPSSSSNNQGSGPDPVAIREDKTPQLINLVYPKRGKGSKKNNILIPAAGFVTLRGTLMGKVNTFTINGEKITLGSGNSFRYLMDITEDGQIIKIFAVTSEGQQRLSLRVRIAS
jgi:hypothetical protein